jgi:hypothetical protein
MNSELLPFWELVLDGIQILVCVMIFSFLIHNKIKYKRWILTTIPPKEAFAFSEEIHIQHLKQLTEKCFDSVIDTINQERLNLQSHFDGDNSLSERSGSVSPAPEYGGPASGSIRPASGSIRPASGSIRPASGSIRPAVSDFKPFFQNEPKSAGDAGFSNFSEIISLTDKGLSIQEISQQLNMPSGEVELIVRLNKEDVGNKHGRMLQAKV